MRPIQRGTVAGIVLAALLILCIPAWASATEDSLRDYGPHTVYVPFKRLYAFSVQCAALPCQIKLAGKTFVDGKALAGLASHAGPPIVMTEQPFAGPEPHCTEDEELESPFSGTCPKKEAWEEAKTHAIYAVWFTPGDLNRTLLNKTLSHHGSATLHVTATLTDATGKAISARRLITLRPVSARRRQERHEAEEERRKENSPQGKAEQAQDEYCVHVLQGEYGGSFVSNGHVYSRCEVGKIGSRHEVTISESQTHG